MGYHVQVETTSGVEVRVGLDADELNDRFLEPYWAGQPIVIGGRTVPIADVARIRITQSDEDVSELAAKARRQHQAEVAEGFLNLGYNEDLAIARMGRDVTDELIRFPAGTGGQAPEGGGAVAPLADAREDEPPVDPRTVFVIHGRNALARTAMFAFLRSINLHPLEWSEARQSTSKASPYVGEILDAAFGTAQAVVVLMTGDDLAHLRSELQQPGDASHETESTPQARPNVLFEAGMAMGRDADRVVIVELGVLRPFSDIGGRHVVRLTDATQDRQELAQRLLTAGADVSLTGTDWHTAGDFEASIDFTAATS